MTSRGATVDRLREFLRELPANARSTLIAELERKLLAGDAIVKLTIGNYLGLGERPPLTLLTLPVGLALGLTVALAALLAAFAALRLAPALVLRED